MNRILLWQKLINGFRYNHFSGFAFLSLFHFTFSTLSKMSAIPSEFLCPITYDIMKSPVVGSDGHTYEEEEIRRHLAVSPYSPMTRLPMDASSLRPNYAIKSQIERYLASAAASAVLPVKPFRSEELAVAASTSHRDGAECVSITLTPPTTGTRQPIVMFIALDNSGSMGESAAADSAEPGCKAFTRMDLCKQTIRTVAAMLADDDMLSIVSFSTAARTVLRPTHMTTDGKDRMESALKSVVPDSQTNIWAGLEMVNRMAAAPELAASRRVAVLLTDGLPNVNPPRGIVPTYKAANKSCTLSTFGFGYNLDSMLLTELAAEGGGSFGFIPDYSMVATVFINWAATVLATASMSGPITLAHADGTRTKLPSETVQYGQPRTILYNSRSPVVTLTVNDVVHATTARDLAVEQAVRSDIMNGIRACIASDGAANLAGAVYDRYKAVDNATVKALLGDINPAPGDAQGQVYMAPRFYQKWGKHYLRAYLNAQEKEVCMNFKDQGLQIYGGDLFHSIQSEGETAFASLPALEPSGSTAAAPYAYGGGGGATPTAAAMAPAAMPAAFYNPQGGCFSGKSPVRMADDTLRPISALRRGDKVWTPKGNTTVQALVTCNMAEPIRGMCHLGELSITPWHPILMDGAWVFPCFVTPIVEVMERRVFNIVLDQDHILDVGGVLCVTLAHGFEGPVISHKYLGTDRVLRDLKRCDGWAEGTPVFRNLVARRNPATKMIEEWYDA